MRVWPLIPAVLLCVHNRERCAGIARGYKCGDPDRSRPAVAERRVEVDRPVTGDEAGRPHVPDQAVIFNRGLFLRRWSDRTGAERANVRVVADITQRVRRPHSGSFR